MHLVGMLAQLMEIELKSKMNHVFIHVYVREEGQNFFYRSFSIYLLDEHFDIVAERES